MDKKIKYIGTKSGKLLRFGGVYGNLQALEALISIAETEGIAPENCICTGDITGYCAQPEEYAGTLASGIWDNMEILPEIEKMGQGIPIYLDTTQTQNTAPKTQKKDGRFLLQP